MYNQIVENLSTWLNKKFLEWQSQAGERKPIRAFAEYLDVRPTSLSNWMNTDIPPSDANIEKLAARLGPEIYDILGRLRPDPEEEKLLSAFRAVPPDDKKALLDLAEKFLVECSKRRVK